MSKRPPHLRTPDYPRSDLARYLAAVMQLFDPACEGVYVSHVERACSELWDRLSPQHQDVARARVEVLYTLFATPDVKRTSVFEVLHERFVLDKFLTWWDSAKDLLEIEGPQALARAAYKAGQQDADERLMEWNAVLHEDLRSTQKTMRQVLEQLTDGTDRDDIVRELEAELEQPRYSKPPKESEDE